MSKHHKTLLAIYAKPTRANIKWNAIEAMFEHYGGEISEGSGSRVRVILNGVVATFHRPHPSPDTSKGNIQSIRRFLSDRHNSVNEISITGWLKFGPYKGYYGLADFDTECRSFHGEVKDTRDVITFAGDDPESLAAAFQESVDDYLAFCKERGKEPDKPFSGNFLVRATPELHRKLSQAAEQSGVSLNQLVVQAIESEVSSDGVKFYAS